MSLDADSATDAHPAPSPAFSAALPPAVTGGAAPPPPRSPIPAAHSYSASAAVQKRHQASNPISLPVGSVFMAPMLGMRTTQIRHTVTCLHMTATAATAAAAAAAAAAGFVDGDNNGTGERHALPLPEPLPPPATPSRASHFAELPPLPDYLRAVDSTPCCSAGGTCQPTMKRRRVDGGLTSPPPSPPPAHKQETKRDIDKQHPAAR